MTQAFPAHERRGRLVPLLREAATRRSTSAPSASSKAPCRSRRCTCQHGRPHAPHPALPPARGHSAVLRRPPDVGGRPRVLARPPPPPGEAARARAPRSSSATCPATCSRPCCRATARSGTSTSSTASTATAPAMLSRVHHCLVDGVSGIELLLAVLDLVPNPEPTPPPAEPWQPNAAAEPARVVVDAVFDTWSATCERVHGVPAAAARPARAVPPAHRRWPRARSRASHGASAARPPTPWNKPRQREARARPGPR